MSAGDVIAVGEFYVGAVDDATIRQTLVELHDLWRRRSLETHVEMGRLIFERLYGGDLEQWRCHGPKDRSFAKLAASLGPDSPLSAASLCRCCGIYIVAQRLGIAALQHLSPTHVVQVLGLPEPHQDRLLRQAGHQGWSTRQLAAQARQVRSALGRRGGRKPTPAFDKGLRRLLAGVEQATRQPVPSDLLSHCTRFGRYTEDQVRDLLGELDRASTQLEQIRAQLLDLLDAACSTKTGGGGQE